MSQLGPKPWQVEDPQLSISLLDNSEGIVAQIKPVCPRCNCTAELWVFWRNGKKFFQVLCCNSPKRPDSKKLKWYCNITPVPEMPIEDGQAAVAAWKLFVALST